MFSLVPSKKPVSRENWDKNQVFTFQFFNDTIYSYLALGNLPKLVFCTWSILSFKNWKVNTSQFSLVTDFFREREKIFYTYSGPMPADIAEMLTSVADNCYIIYVPWTQIVTNYLWNVRIICWAHNYHLRSLAIWAAQSGPNGRLSCLHSFKIVWPMKPSFISNQMT